MDESKYTKIPNELLEAILEYRFTAAQLIVLLYVIRKTYGWNKHMDSISISKIAKDTQFSRRSMVSAVSDLVKLCVLNVEEDGAGHPKMMYIRDPSDWDKPVNPTSHVKSASHVNSTSQGGVKRSSQVGVKPASQGGVKSTSHTKDIYKDNKEIYKESQNPKKKGWGDFEEHNYNWDMIESLLGRKIREEN